MARLVSCTCGRKFHVGDGPRKFQCRCCGRWWSGEEVGRLQAAAILLTGGEVAKGHARKGTRQRQQGNQYTKPQTKRRQKHSNPLASAWNLFFR